MKEALSREALIELVTKLIDPKLSDNEAGRLGQIFNENVPHPAGSNLIFWPSHAGVPDELKPEEIVDIALAYKPPALHMPSQETPPEPNRSQG